MSLKYNFTGKTVLVTGGSTGIGFGLVKALAECGARVISLSRTVGELQALKQDNAHYSIDIIKCDVRNWAELDRVGKSLPPVDCLVNNAGVWRYLNFGEISLEDADSIFDTNVKAIINLSQVITNVWKARKIKGVIVNVSSLASKVAVETLSIYSASKAAVDSLTRSMALELSPFGIRVNSVNPTVILVKRIVENVGNTEGYEAVRARTPLNRLGEVDEVVDAIMYLLTDRCTLMTGAHILLDGGYSAC